MVLCDLCVRGGLLNKSHRNMAKARSHDSITSLLICAFDSFTHSHITYITVIISLYDENGVDKKKSIIWNENDEKFIKFDKRKMKMWKNKQREKENHHDFFNFFQILEPYVQCMKESRHSKTKVQRLSQFSCKRNIRCKIKPRPLRPQ